MELPDGEENDDKEEEETCRDSVEFCASWAEDGYCDNPEYRSYMLNKCCVSCLGEFISEQNII